MPWTGRQENVPSPHQSRESIHVASIATVDPDGGLRRGRVPALLPGAIRAEQNVQGVSVPSMGVLCAGSGGTVEHVDVAHHSALHEAKENAKRMSHTFP